VGLVALGAPLLGASAAQGANGASQVFTGPQVNRPVVVSATPGLPGLVRVQFFTNGGAAIAPFGGGSYLPDNFQLTGYDDSFDLHALTAEQADNSTIVLSFGTESQLSQYTNLHIDEDTVQANVTGSPQGNESDSIPFNVPTASATKNGTRGFSTGPDLQTILRGADVGGNRMAFVFDQNVDENELCDSLVNGSDTPCWTTDFLFYTGDGDLHGDTGAAIISITDNVVVVDYSGTVGPPTNDAVSDARIALVNERADSTGVPNPPGTNDAGRLRSDQCCGGSKRNPMFSVAVPGSGGNTSSIDFTSAETVAGGDSSQIAFHFDGQVSLTARGLNNPDDCFIAVLSNANLEPATSAIASGDTVFATFNGGETLQQFSELAIGASVQQPKQVGPDVMQDPGVPLPNSECVRSATGQVPNTMGGKPVGGNEGAVGTGYTTGPDALGLSRGPAGSGILRVRVDQRVEPGFGNGIEPMCIRLIDDQGAPFGPFPTSAAVTGNGSPYDAHVVQLTFDPTAADQAAGLQLLGNPHDTGCASAGDGALETFDGDVFEDEANISQVFGFGGLTG